VVAIFDELGKRHPELVETKAGKLTGDKDQALRLRVRQRPQDDAVDDTEYCGIGTDPEGQRQDGDGGESRLAPERPERVTQILQERVHGVVRRVRPLRSWRREAIIIGS
jgi:propanediol dehydratase small subunit